MTPIGTYRGITIELDGRGDGTLYAYTNRGSTRVQVAQYVISTTWHTAYDGIRNGIDRWLDGTERPIYPQSDCHISR